MRLLAALILLAPTLAFADAKKPPAAAPKATAAAEPSDFPVGPGVEPLGVPETRKALEKPVDLPLWQGELRIGMGMSRAGTSDGSKMGTSPLSLTAIGAVAINQDPTMYVYAGLTSEMLSRSFIGATAGGRIQMNDLPVRFGGGGVMMFAPTTLWGAQASGGACKGKGAFALCGDVQMTAYFGGTGLDNDKTEMQIQFVLGIEARGGH
ncbi:MAG TPA: hypothetical protein VGM39_12455 [Kofleriaceae bacterium]